MKKYAFIPLIFVLFFQFNACAIFNRENHRLVNLVEEKIVPKDKTLKIITAPIYIPIGIISGILDVFLIHPIAVLPEVGKDTIDALWTPHGLKYVTTMGVIPFSLVATPFFFVLDWGYRWFFEDSGYSNQNKKQSTKDISQEEWIQKLTEAFQSNQKEELISLVQKCHTYNTNVPISKLLISIHKKYRGVADGVAMETLYCIYNPKENYELYEDYIIDEFNRLDQNTMYYAIGFIKNFKSEKGSRAILAKITDPNTSENNLFGLIQHLFEINHKPHVDAFIKRVRK